jgi:hypothetical protein
MIVGHAASLPVQHLSSFIETFIFERSPTEKAFRVNAARSASAGALLDAE